MARGRRKKDIASIVSYEIKNISPDDEVQLKIDLFQNKNAKSIWKTFIKLYNKKYNADLPEDLENIEEIVEKYDKKYDAVYAKVIKIAIMNLILSIIDIINQAIAKVQSGKLEDMTEKEMIIVIEKMSFQIKILADLYQKFFKKDEDEEDEEDSNKFNLNVL